jgi:hypothetical protein
MMGKIVCAIACAALLSGCSKYIFREREVYEAELGLYEHFGRDGASSLYALIHAHCTCEAGQWVGRDCRQADERAALLERRMPWHLAMSAYNAGLTDDAPAAVPPALVLGCAVEGSGDE